MKKRIVLILVIGVIIINISLLSAGIYFSNIQSKYNLGDMVNLDITVEPVLENFLLKTDLICENKEVITFNNLPEEGKVNIKLPLNFYTIKEVSGECFFQAEYSDEVKQSKKFEISKRLVVFLDSDSFFANPGEEVTISGYAERLNGVKVNGESEITIPILNLGNQVIEDSSEEVNESEDEDTSEEGAEEESDTEETAEIVDSGKFYGKVTDGNISVSFTLPEDTPAGDYRIDVYVYEKVAERKTSEGITTANLKIFQVLTSANIALSNQNFDPGAVFSFKPSLLDQSGASISDEVSVIIRNEDSERIYEKIVQSDETVDYNIPTNMSSGYYEVEISNKNINAVKKFYINEKEIVSFELKNNTLIVTNIGNIPYNKDIEIEINGKPFVRKVNLGLGESTEFKLTGSNEEYNIKISDGETEISEGGVVLTGYAVGVDEIKKGISVKGPIVWIFLIIILGAGILFLFRNVFKKKSFAYPIDKLKSKFKRHKEDFGSKTNSNELKKPQPVSKIVPGALVAPNEAEHVLVLKGHKNRVTVVVLKIKNKIGKNEKQSLEKAIEQVYNKRGAVYEQGDYIFIVFSPLITRTLKNEVEATKSAEKILLVLKEHNKKFKDKIDFGIGINSGEIINKIEDKKLKFTALGNLIPVAKRLASASDKQILVTKEAYEKGISEIKAEKRKIGSGDVYEVRGVIDSDKNKKFIRDFLNRMDKDEKAVIGGQ